MTVNHGAKVVFEPNPPVTKKSNGVDIVTVSENGENKFSGVKLNATNGTSSTGQYTIPLNPQLAFAARKIRVITIGAGYSGLIIAHKFQHRYPEMQEMVQHTIFESRSEVGGTWLVNTYPGVQCDVPAHIYVRSHPTIY